MQTANHILQAIRKLGEERQPLTRIYRCLYSEDLFLAAYNKIGRNQGALTPGSGGDTADGMSLERIRAIIEQLRQERYHFRPARRTYVPKKSGGTRPLGMPDFDEKLVQEVLRMVLEAYYEPRFRESSHGFRPNLGCHTALREIKLKFVGSTWFIEGDIRGCFDNIDHQILLNILARDIHDGRLLELIRRGLTAGVMEEWEYRKSHSGTPQGGVLSPLLANIYLHKLDTYIEDVLIPQYTQGQNRKVNPTYNRLQHQLESARKRGDEQRITEIIKQKRQLPVGDPQDPNYRRLRYVRYADDFILGFIGSREEAEAIKQAIGEFLRNELHLELSDNKTLITHAKTEEARFLSYTLTVVINNDKCHHGKGRKGQARSVNGGIQLGIPRELPDERCKPYLRNGKTISDSILVHNSDAHIIDVYQQRYRGLAEYYRYAQNRASLNKLRYIMEQSLVKTLAHKFRISVREVYARYKRTLEIDGHPHKVLLVEVPTERGTRTIYWGGISLKVVKHITQPIDDLPYQEKWTARADLIQRLQANTCELCGSHENIEVHHVRKLADLKKKWSNRKHVPLWVKRMVAIRRKTLIVCRKCHRDIHAGRPTPDTRE
jgi:group II intron reverse transcriptase/maturase